MMLTVSAVAKENLELSNKSRILEEETKTLKDQLRIINERYVRCPTGQSASP